MGLWWGEGDRIDKHLIQEKVETYIQKSDEGLHLA